MAIKLPCVIFQMWGTTYKYLSLEKKIIRKKKGVCKISYLPIGQEIVHFYDFFYYFILKFLRKSIKNVCLHIKYV